MRVRGLVVLALVLVLTGAGDAVKKVWTFEDGTIGERPSGFVGASGEWKVVASDDGKALGQLAESPDAVFNVVLVDGVHVKDVELSVRLRAIAGKDDRGGGLVWRARDAKNYYVARFNHLEDNFRVYKVVDGKRTMFQSADVKHHDGWTDLRVTMVGDRITCYLDGKKYLDVQDSTFPDAGTIGLWSKADARTQFDDLTLRGD
jgi:hypothetical protein